MPLWLWPNVLSLDAAFIAALWHVFLARLLGLHTGIAEPAILALSVWIIYVLDHVLDSRRAVPAYPEPIRKTFYRRFGTRMLAVAGGGTILAAVLAPFALPPPVLRMGIPIALAVVLYLAVVHLSPVQQRRKWPREGAVALLFSIGTVSPLALIGEVPKPVLGASGSLILLLVWTNCCIVETLDFTRAERNRQAAPHRTAFWVDGHLKQVAFSLVVLSICLAGKGEVPAPFAAAVAVSALAMAYAGYQTNPFSLDVRTLLVDAALCSPLLIPITLWTRP